MNTKHTANNKTRLFFSILTILALLVLPAGASSASPSPFTGNWQAIDVDGSDIRLTIAGPPNGPFTITWTESYISFCDGQAGIMRGTGWLAEGDPNTLEADLHLKCFTTGASWDGHLTLRYHPATNTLSTRYENGMVVIWHRPGQLPPSPPALGLRVNYGHDWVESFLEAGHTVWITVTESDGVTVKAMAEVVTEPKDFWGGETGFQTAPEDWDPAPPDIQPYDWIFAWMDNGASAQVQIGDIQGEVYIFDDRITGTIMAPWITDPVQVECLDWGSVGGPFNKEAGAIYANGADPYTCTWDPGLEWDLQAWQDIGVGYFTPDGHWVANAIHAEHWMAMWTYDLPAGFWSEGEHSYYFKWAYTIPEPDSKVMDLLAMTVSRSSAGGDTPIYPGYVLIQPWSSTPQLAWTGSACEGVPVVHPDQPTRFVWGWVNDYSMSYEEALDHFTSFTVEAYWDVDGVAQLMMGELVPFTGMDARWEYRCTLTEHPPEMGLRVNYGHDWVESFYEAGHVVWITVTESDGMTVKATAEVVTEPKDFWGGETGFQTQPEDWIPAPPDIQPYDWVYASVDNGESAQVQIGDIAGTIDLAADAIQGAIYAPWFTGEVNVECHPWGAPEPTEMKFDTVQPDGVDPYSCSWAGEWEIQPGQDVGVGYFGLDGHWVANAFHVPYTRFTTFPEQEYIEGWEWSLGTTVHLTIDDPGTEVIPDFEQYGIAVTTPWNPSGTWVTFNFAGAYNMKPGDIVTLSDMMTTRTHTVQNLAITGVDKAADTVAGMADPGALVYVWPHEYGEYELQSTAGEAGAWLADFASLGFDLVEGMAGRSEIRDEVGNATAVDWWIPNPHFTAFPEQEYIEGWEWSLGTTVHLAIDDPATGALTDYEQDELALPTPWDPNQTWVQFNFNGLYNMKLGDVITLSDGTTTRTHTVQNLAINAIDVVADTVAGTADPGALVHVWAHEYNEYELQPTVGEDGTWLAEFGSNGFDLVEGMCGRAEIRDEAGNSTAVDWCIPSPPPQPRIVAHITDDWFEAQNFSPNTNLTFWIYDAPDGDLLWGSFNRLADASGTAFVGGWEHQVDLQPGHYLVVSTGTTTKEIILEALTFDLLDLNTGHVEGTAPAPAGRTVWIGIGFQDSGWDRVTTTDENGYWAAEFEQPVLIDFTWAAAQVFDEDGDATEDRPAQIVNWQP